MMFQNICIFQTNSEFCVEDVGNNLNLKVITPFCRLPHYRDLNN